MKATNIITLYKDTNGNLYCHEKYDDCLEMHLLTEVEEYNGCYTYTYSAIDMTNEEFANLTKIEVEV